MHVEGKKAVSFALETPLHRPPLALQHHLEQERLKLELNRAQRTAAEQTERADKLKKQNDALDTRLQEMRKINLSDQSEIKDLRAKLRIAEHERSKLSSKQGDAGDVKKALQALDVKRRDELKERDKKIAELEKALATEKRRKDAAEAKLVEIRGGVDAEVRQAQATTKGLDAELRAAKAESEQAKMSRKLRVHFSVPTSLTWIDEP